MSKQTVARDLIAVGAVFLRPEQPFTWASGIRSPIYCDNRLTLSDPAVRSRLEREIADCLQEHFPQAELLMGTATAGIAHAAIASHLLSLPMGYVRGAAKDHGRGNRIEGRLLPGQKTVVIEDLISTGGSVLEAVEALREAGADVLGVVSIFTYGMERAAVSLSAAGVENYSLTDFDTVIEEAAALGKISPAALPRLRAFRDNPSDESWITEK